MRWNCLALGACAWFFLGCGAREQFLGRAQGQPPAQVPPTAEQDGSELKSRFLRALSTALNDAADGDDGSSGIDRDDHDEMLHQADRELSQVLEQHPREAILRANCRMPEVVIDPLPLMPGEGPLPSPSAAVPQGSNAPAVPVPAQPPASAAGGH